MILDCEVFFADGTIPERYTCDGDNVSPPLSIRDIPADAKSLAIIMDDPDAPMGLFTHWVIWNIPPTTEAIEEDGVPQGAREGNGSSGKHGYTGPCPPDREHRYFFHLYALDVASTFAPAQNARRLKKQ